MKMTTLLDVDLVAVENDHEVTLLLELTAPAPAAEHTRAPATLQVVLDRSGSMGGGRLEGAKAALLTLVDRLEPTDNFGLVAFDQDARVVVPAGPLTDKATVKGAIAGLNTGGSTDLSGGYLRGLQEARRVAGPSGATLLLISDGHANSGVRDPERLGGVAAESRAHGVTTSTLGWGEGYDELLLSAMARGGAGNELFALDVDSAAPQIAGEVEGLLEQAAQAVSLRVHLTPHVEAVALLNELPAAPTPDGVTVELGSFYAGEHRRLVMTFAVPGVAALGLLEIASLELVHVSLPDLVQHTHRLPVVVNVVPGDETTGLVPDPVVSSEVLFQRSQQVKREAGRLLSEGDVDGAVEALGSASQMIVAGLAHSSLAGVSPGTRAELTEELGLIGSLASTARHSSSVAAKMTSMDVARKSRTRGRQERS